MSNVQKSRTPALRFTTSRPRQLLSFALTAAAALTLAVFSQVFYTSPDPTTGEATLWLQPWAMLCSAATALALGVVIWLRPLWLGERGEKLRRWWVLGLYLLLPVASLTMMEYLGGVFTYSWSVLTFFRNYAFTAVLYLFLYALSGGIRVPIIVLNVVYWIFGMVNHYLIAFRGTPFLPSNITSLKTGLSVAGNYDYSPDHEILLGTLLLLLILAVGVQLRPLALHKILRRGLRVLGLVLVVVFSTLLYQTDWFANYGMQPDFFDQARGYRNHGSLVQFWINTKYLKVNPPDNYSSEEVPQITQDMITTHPEEVAEKKLPNVICIMNETLSDLQVVGDFTTNIDYMPTLHSLTEDTVQGELYVSVYGAGTANSEFEFLTGDTLAFLPAGSCAYESYVEEPMPSLVSSLETLGYSKTALHPYYGGNWQREQVYPLLGFERYLSIEDLLGTDLVDAYRASGNFWEYSRRAEEKYPGQNVFLRRYISDEFNVKQVKDLYETRNQERPFFLFNITMQNHSGYDMVSANFEEEVWLTGELEGKYPKVNQYLSLIKRSDEAMAGLLAYFAQVDEPTVILIFGDHQPSVEMEFYEEIMGKTWSEMELAERQQMYRTPFYIWANYDIAEGEVDAISANYLASLLLETAGLPLTEYQRYLSDLRKHIPVINANGYLASDGNWYDLRDEDAPFYQHVADYDKVQYNNLFDTENRVEDLYLLKKVPLAEETAE